MIYYQPLVESSSSSTPEIMLPFITFIILLMVWLGVCLIAKLIAKPLEKAIDGLCVKLIYVFILTMPLLYVWNHDVESWKSVTACSIILITMILLSVHAAKEFKKEIALSKNKHKAE